MKSPLKQKRYSFLDTGRRIRLSSVDTASSFPNPPMHECRCVGMAPLGRQIGLRHFPFPLRELYDRDRGTSSRFNNIADSELPGTPWNAICHNYLQKPKFTADFPGRRP